MTNFDVKMIEQWRIMEVITGSQLYGLATPESDTDYRGVCLPPMSILLNPFENFDQKFNQVYEQSFLPFGADRQGLTNLYFDIVKKYGEKL